MKYYLTLALFCFYNLIVNSQELIITPTAPSEPTGQRNSSKKNLLHTMQTTNRKVIGGLKLIHVLM